MVHRFTLVFEALERSAHGARAPQGQLAELVRYFEVAPPADAAWAVFLLLGGRLPRTVSAEQLRATAQQLSGLPAWLFEASLTAATDLAECIALVLPPPAVASHPGLAQGIEQRLLPLRGLLPEQQHQALAEVWRDLDAAERQLTVQLLSGGWRSPVSGLILQQALAQVVGISPHTVAQRLKGYATPHGRPRAADFLALLAAPDSTTQRGQPYRFVPVQTLPAERPVAQLGGIDAWLLELQYNGLRVQVVRRAGACFIWSEPGELWTARLPEVEHACDAWPDGTVLAGELLVWPAGAERPLPLPRLLQRLARKTLTPQLLRELPCVFMANDVWEWQGVDVRHQPLRERRLRLEQCFGGVGLSHPASGPLRLSPRLQASDWATAAVLRQAARQQGAQGLSLRSLDATIGTLVDVDVDADADADADAAIGVHPEGPSAAPQAEPAAWVWLSTPMQLTAVLLYAQSGVGPGSGASTAAFNSYTFGVWNRAPQSEAEVQAVQDAIAAKRPPPLDPASLRLLPVAKAHSGLNEQELETLNLQVRTQAVEKFGPVRSLLPSLVVELVFDSITSSARHKSGLLLGGVRMLRLRPKSGLGDVDSMAQLRALQIF
jgi:DNA ligase 1